MIKLLAVDMDGTCLDSKSVMSDDTLAALKKANENNVTVVPTTGRNVTCLPSKIKNEDFYRYIISSNGALVVDRETDSIIFKSFISTDIACEILKKCRRHNILVAAHIDRDYYVQGGILYLGVKHFLKDDAPTLRCVRNLASYIRKNNCEVEEFQFFYFGEKYRDIIKKIIEPYPDICSAHSKGYAEIYNKSGSKGNALLALAEHLGIPDADTACIGDEENDKSMFGVAGTKFAMGNAIPQIKDMADVILPTNDEDGVAFAINNYVLPEQK